MNQSHGAAFYSTVFVENDEEGFAGVELHRLLDDKKETLARVVFWDAYGDFEFEAFNTQIPVAIVEELIAEAKATIKTN